MRGRENGSNISNFQGFKIWCLRVNDVVIHDVKHKREKK